jgi:hypothetical protein
VPQARIREAEAINRVPNLEAEEIAAIESAFKAGGVEFDRAPRRQDEGGPLAELIISSLMRKEI